MARRRRGGKGQDDVRLKRNQFGCLLAHGCRIARAPAIVDADILSDRPTRLLQGLRESGQPREPFSIVRGKRCEDANAPHPVRPLRPRRERQCCRSSAYKRNELTPPHSITSSAAFNRPFGTLRPSAFAVLRLMTSSNFVPCTTGKSAGFSPLRIRPAYRPTCRYESVALPP